MSTNVVQLHYCSCCVQCITSLQKDQHPIMDLAFNPFDKPLQHLGPDDLSSLRDVPESWFIDYKRDPVDAASTAKQLCAFANSRGGWLLFGIEEAAGKRRIPGTFPGLSDADVSTVQQRLVEAALTHVSPTPMYDIGVVRGPAADVGLPADRSVVVVRVARSSKPPHVHSTGVIFSRIADTSSPLGDRASLDRLVDWAHARRQAKESIVAHLLKTVGERAPSPWVGLVLSADRYGDNAVPPISFEQFLELAKTGPDLAVPFDNCNPIAGGFAAQQFERNDPGRLVPSWYYLDGGLSVFVMPLPLIDLQRLSASDHYDHAAAAVEKFEERRIPAVCADLNVAMHFMAAAVYTHRRILGLLDSNRHWKLYSRLTARRVRGLTPFLDVSSFIGQLQHGVPVVPIDDFDVPAVGGSDDWFELPARPRPTVQGGDAYADAASLAFALFPAMGIACSTIADGAYEIGDAFMRYRSGAGL